MGRKKSLGRGSGRGKKPREKVSAPKGKSVVVVLTLEELRNKLKREPEGYKEEFLQQYEKFKATYEILKIRANSNTSISHRQNKDISELIDFVAHGAPFYAQDCREYPVYLLDLLENYLEGLDPVLRRNIVKSVILLRNRNFVSPLSLLPVFFKLFRANDKALRKIVFTHIVRDIARVNKRHKDVKLNASLQNFMYKMLQDENPIAVRKSLGVMIELYRKHIWRDAKTVNVLSNACFSRHSAVLRTALQFFLGEVVQADDDAEEERQIRSDLVKIQQAMRTSKKRSKRKREIDRAQSKLKKMNNKDKEPETRDFSLIRSVYDPQSFTERLFTALKRSNEAFDIRVLYMNVISRFIGCHKLELYDFYSFLQRYMNPHQEYVTKILVYLAQSCHDTIPPEVLEPCIQTLANHFVTDRSSPEVIAVGLNSIREMCTRQPLAMNKTLLQDLTQYKSFKNKSVSIAARSIIQLYRNENPELLMKKDRGAPSSTADTQIKGFGHVDVPKDIGGADILMQRIERRKQMREALGQNDEESDEEESKIFVENSDSDDDGVMVVELDDFDESDDEFQFDGGEEQEKMKASSSHIEISKEKGIRNDKAIDKNGEGSQPTTTKKSEVPENHPENEDESENSDDDFIPLDGNLPITKVSKNTSSSSSTNSDNKKKPKNLDSNKDNISSSSSSSSSVPSPKTEIDTEKKKDLPAAARKLFTQEEFEQLKEIRLQKVIRDAKARGKKRIVVMPQSEKETSEFAIDEGDIKSFGVNARGGKRKKDQINNDEEDGDEKKGKKNAKYGYKKVAGTTNEDKRRNKVFAMSLYSRRSKKRRARSFNEKISTKRRHDYNVKNNSHKRKRKKKLRK